MTSYLHYTTDKNNYHRIPQKGLYALICLLFVLAGAIIAYRRPDNFGYACAGVCLVIGLSYLPRMFSKVSVDLDRKVILYKPSLFSEQKTFPLSQVSNLFLSTRIYALVLNARAFIVIHDGSKEHHLRIGQSLMTPKPMEKLLLETEEIIGFHPAQNTAA
ncbi:hypothetical protein [Dyadobacter sp. CY312]|uniref:hypothetical protein n=1 Tax=Dyadobacter sp. CY312 TaxID=2907303 RepID=UPI001F2C6AA4|nr:hypothetical protein [Dyadobacter sp. CY312]MCE7040146.1 hypothetical protein [Dyadobacter sp. CY312]